MSHGLSSLGPNFPRTIFRADDFTKSLLPCSRIGRQEKLLFWFPPTSPVGLFFSSFYSTERCDMSRQVVGYVPRSHPRPLLGFGYWSVIRVQNFFGHQFGPDRNLIQNQNRIALPKIRGRSPTLRIKFVCHL